MLFRNRLTFCANKLSVQRSLPSFKRITNFIVQRLNVCSLISYFKLSSVAKSKFLTCLKC
ncbi:MAG: hypothetical protein ACTS42_00315 [Candidatus Hodgkinia cicadicola]